MIRKKATTTSTDGKQEKKQGGYVVPPGEENYFHVEVEQRNFDPKTGERLSRPTVQKFDPKTWAMVSKQAARLGYDHIEILHEPKTK